jgi:hypothetical protein
VAELSEDFTERRPDLQQRSGRDLLKLQSALFEITLRKL